MSGAEEAAAPQTGNGGEEAQCRDGKGGQQQHSGALHQGNLSTVNTDFDDMHHFVSAVLYPKEPGSAMVSRQQMNFNLYVERPSGLRSRHNGRPNIMQCSVFDIANVLLNPASARLLHPPFELLQPSKLGRRAASW